MAALRAKQSKANLPQQSEPNNLSE